MRLGWYGHAEEVKLSSHNQRQGMKLLLEMPKDTCKCLNHTLQTHTLWLSKLVEDHNVMGVIKVFSKGMDVFSSQPVGHEDCCFVSVCPVNTILRHRRKTQQVRTSLLESCEVWILFYKFGKRCFSWTWWCLTNKSHRVLRVKNTVCYFNTGIWLVNRVVRSLKSECCIRNKLQNLRCS